MPTITIVAAMSAYAVRMMRESLDSSYVLMARLKGLPRWRVLLFHALLNALGPAIKHHGAQRRLDDRRRGGRRGVFEFPGIGRLMVDSISNKYVPVVLAISVVMTSA